MTEKNTMTDAMEALEDALSRYIDEHLADDFADAAELAQSLVDEQPHRTEDEVRRIVRDELASQPDDGDGDQEGDGPAWFDAVGGFRSTPTDRVGRSDADEVVADPGSLAEHVGTAGLTIWVPGDASIDLAQVSQLSPARDVTIASNRNVPEGQPGGRLRVSTYDPTHAMKTRADGIRLSGLRLEGPDGSWIKNYDPAKIRCLGLFYGDDFVVDNCEVYGWPFAGLALGAQNHPSTAEVRHCHFHDNLMEGLGYGLELFDGQHDIHHCYFDRCRHAIAGFGYETNGYDAHHNVVGPEPLSHAFDMHSTEENVSDGDATAGGTITIRTNLFQFTHDLEGRAQEAIAIRGVPADRCDIDHNHFRHARKPTGSGGQGDAYRQERVDSWMRIWASGNTFGSTLTFKPPDGG